MPTFAWKLTDEQVAEVSTYVRNSWGNRASPVTAEQVRTLRRKLGLETTPRP
jgi:mono/diheme cytochrome c family protein